MKSAAILCAIFALAIASAAPAQSAGDRLNLVCLGAGAANKPTSTQAFGWNSDGDSAGATIIGNRAVPFDDQVNLWIEGADGQIRMPRAMLPVIRGGKDGWFQLKSLKVSDSEIIGSVAVNVLNNPRLRIDRMTGAISISGKAGDYSGTCRKFDPTSTPRAF